MSTTFHSSLVLHGIVRVRYQRSDYAADATCHAFTVHNFYLFDDADEGVERLQLVIHAGDIDFVDFPTASEGPVEATGNVRVASDVMAPAPERVAPPVAGGPSKFGTCPHCGVEIRVRNDGNIPQHSPGRGIVTGDRFSSVRPTYCEGSNQPPMATPGATTSPEPSALSSEGSVPRELPPVPPLTDAQAEKLTELVVTNQVLAEMPHKDLVELALRLLDEPPSHNFEQVVEELCSRVYPNWPNEIPPENDHV